MKIDPNKKYRYRNGEPARILCVDADGIYPIVSLQASGDPVTHTEDGKYYPHSGQDALDLIEVREPREWKAVVCIKDGVLPSGHLAHYDEGDELDPNYEIVRVREIID